MGFAKQKSQKSTNVVTPYNFNETAGDDRTGRPAAKEGSRYKKEDILDDSLSRDVSADEEDFNFGDDDDDEGVVFDDEDLFGDKNEKKGRNNRSKMLLNELGADAIQDTDQDLRQQTLMEDETGALNSNRNMVMEDIVSPTKS